MHFYISTFILKLILVGGRNNTNRQSFETCPKHLALENYLVLLVEQYEIIIKGGIEKLWSIKAMYFWCLHL